MSLLNNAYVRLIDLQEPQNSVKIFRNEADIKKHYGNCVSFVKIAIDVREIIQESYFCYDEDFGRG